MHHNPQSYTCPMHSEISQDKPGLCSVCGMRLLKGKKREDKGLDKHKGHTIQPFKRKFWISLVLSIPVVLYSDISQELLQWQPPEFTGSHLIPLVLSTVIFFYGGWIFVSSAYRELLARLPGMMTLISLAILTAYLYSLYVELVGQGRDLFWELSTLITVMLLGHWMEMRAVSGAQAALQELSKLLPETAEVVYKAGTKSVPLHAVKKSDLVLVKPGGKFPTDGEVVEGVSEVNESIVTGESKLVLKKRGSEVIAGTINGDGSLQVRVTKIGEETFLAGVMRLVREAQASKSRLQLLSDRAAFYLTLVAIVTGAATLLVWLGLKDPAFALERTVAVLVIACPHALGLAIPLVASISTTRAAQNGFLVRERLSLEAARQIDTVLFDKTGTLTTGEYGVEQIVIESSVDKTKLLQLAASVESRSEHPTAQAIVRKAEAEGLELLPVREFQRLPGRGVRGKVQGRELLVGGERVLGKIRVPEKLKLKLRGEAEKGKTIVYLLVNGQLAGALILADLIRPESYEAVSSLRKLGIRTAMVTGDSEAVAHWVADELEVDEYFARVLPEEKSERVVELKRRGLKVAMVGDGVNDAPALVQADLGVAIGAGTNVAVESAGIILVKNDPRDIVKIIKLSKKTYLKMIQNLFWATGYNVVAIPLAAGVLASQGVLLKPAVAALLMSLSTVIVAVNALFLKRVEL